MLPSGALAIHLAPPERRRWYAPSGGLERAAREGGRVGTLLSPEETGLPVALERLRPGSRASGGLGLVPSVS
jgi:hypothetical protein